MAKLENKKHEAFARLLAEDWSQTDAYDEVYKSRHTGNASTLAKNPKVKARVEELKVILQPRTNVTRQSLVEEAEFCRLEALQSGKTRDALEAIRLKAQLEGVLIERHEQRITPHSQLSDEEIADRLRQVSDSIRRAEKEGAETASRRKAAAAGGTTQAADTEPA